MQGGLFAGFCTTLAATARNHLSHVRLYGILMHNLLKVPAAPRAMLRENPADPSHFAQLELLPQNMSMNRT
jgi:hypothetical protein